MLDKEAVSAIAAAVKESMLIGPKPGLTIPETCALLPFGKSKLYELIAAGEFPKPRRFAPGVTGYARRDVESWIESRPLVETEYRGTRRRGRG